MPKRSNHGVMSLALAGLLGWGAAIAHAQEVRPLAPVLEPAERDIVILRFVEERRAASDVFLFPALEENRRGSKADSIGKWFGRLRRKLLADVPEVQGAKGLHSLRHSFTRATRDQKIEQGILWALGGWSDGKARNSAGEYGSGYSLATLKEAIDKIEYPGADFSALYPIAIRSRSRSSSTN